MGRKQIINPGPDQREVPALSNKAHLPTPAFRPCNQTDGRKHRNIAAQGKEQFFKHKTKRLAVLQMMLVPMISRINNNGINKNTSL